MPRKKKSEEDVIEEKKLPEIELTDKLILAGDWKGGHTLFNIVDGEAVEALSFGGTEIKEGKKKIKLSPEQFFARMNEQVSMPLKGKNIYMVMLQPNIVVSSIFIKLGAKIYGMPSFIGKCKGVAGQAELVTKTLAGDDWELRFAELTGQRLKTSSIATLCSSIEDFVKIRIQIGNRIDIDEYVRFAMGEVGLDEVTNKRLEKMTQALREKLNGVVLEAEKQAKYEREKILATDPIYKAVFEPKYQIGPSLAGKLMTEILTIDRFKTKAKLYAYFFGRQTADGKAPSSKKGQASNWNKEGKSALYLWAQQLQRAKDSRPDDIYVKRFLHYLELYKSRIGVEIEGKETIQNGRHAFYCAYRQVAKKLLHHIWREWREVERAMTPNRITIEPAVEEAIKEVGSEEAAS